MGTFRATATRSGTQGSQVGDPVQASAEVLQHPRIPHCVQRPWMDAGPDGLTRAQNPTMAVEHFFRRLERRVSFGLFLDHIG